MHPMTNSLANNNWNAPNMQQQPPKQQPPPAMSNMNALNLVRDIEKIVAQQSTLRDQIRQSEQNLTAQHGVCRLCQFIQNIQ